MASGNQASEHLGQDDNMNNKGELERVKEYLQEVVRKNQGLEEMLLYTTQELEKEKENSRKIVQTLTERLMESREMINKLEVENMRYKKDCMLAVELLQCNRSIDQGYVSTTVRKLSDYKDPIGHHTSSTFGNPFAVNEHDHTNIDKTTKDNDTKNVQATRPRTLSKKKNKSEVSANDDDTTALLDKQETNEAKGKVLERARNKIMKEDTSLEYHKDLKENQYVQETENSLPSVIDNSQQKESDNPQDFEGMSVKDSTKGHYFKDENVCLPNGYQQEIKPLSTNKQSEITDSQVVLNSVEPRGSNSEDSRPNEIECLTDERIQEDKPLMVNETEPSTQQQILSTPGPNKNMKRRGENAQAETVCHAERKNIDDAKQSSFISTTTVENEDISRIKSLQEGAEENEKDKLLSLDAERNEESYTQQISSETTKAASKLALLAEDNVIEAENNEAEVMVAINGDEGKSSMDDPTKTESETNDGQVDTPVVEADDGTTTAEENTPLV